MVIICFFSSLKIASTAILSLPWRISWKSLVWEILTWRPFQLPTTACTCIWAKLRWVHLGSSSLPPAFCLAGNILDYIISFCCISANCWGAWGHWLQVLCSCHHQTLRSCHKGLYGCCFAFLTLRDSNSSCLSFFQPGGLVWVFGEWGRENSPGSSGCPWGGQISPHGKFLSRYPLTSCAFTSNYFINHYLLLIFSSSQGEQIAITSSWTLFPHWLCLEARIWWDSISTWKNRLVP